MEILNVVRTVISFRLIQLYGAGREIVSSLRAGKRYLSTDFRLHISSETPYADHFSGLGPGLAGSPNYCGFLNNLLTLINCESVKEIGEMAVTIGLCYIR